MALVLAAAALAAPGSAYGVGLSLDRSPAPPQAVTAGTGIETISWSVSFTDTPYKVVVSLVRPDGTVETSWTTDLTSAASPGSASDTVRWTPQQAAPTGRYRITLAYWSESDLNTPESTASAAFDVAAQLGTLSLVAFEDLNGDGVRQAGEAGLPGWRFDLVNPFGAASSVATGTDGTLTLSGVPAGTWSATEEAQAGWRATGPAAGEVAVPMAGTGTLQVGSARPAAISGRAFLDANRNRTMDPWESGTPNVTLTLAGTDGAGRSVSAQTVSAADGSYAFANLWPGVYSVTVAPPVGLGPTTPVSRASLVALSGGVRDRVDFGLATAPAIGVLGALQPTDLRLVKAGPAHAAPGAVVVYTLRVTNVGGATARSVMVRDPLPARMTLAGPPALAQVLNGVVVWRMGDIAPGRTRAVVVRMRVDPTAPAGRYRNVATASADNAPARRATADMLVRGAPRRVRVGGVTG